MARPASANPAPDQWTRLAAELLDILDCFELSTDSARLVEHPPLVPPSPLRDVAPTAAIPVDRFVLPPETIEARDASHSDLTKVLLKMARQGKLERRHAFDLHPDSTEGRLARFNVEANVEILSRLDMPDPALLAPSSVEREAARVAALVSGISDAPGPEVRRGEPARLGEALRSNRELLAIVNLATGESAPDSSVIVPHPLGRARLPGEPVAHTPDGRVATREPASVGRTAPDGRPARSGVDFSR